MKSIALTLVSVVFMYACNTGNQSNKDGATNTNNFGEVITPDGAQGVAHLLSQLETKEEVDMKLRGSVKAVCKKKGCWVTLVDQNVPDQEVFVKFKDYGFFLPLDCEGTEVVMKGKGFVEVTSVDELRHYAEDEGKSAEEIAAITEPTEELKFMADGVVFVTP